jgi:hypothetical protein
LGYISLAMKLSKLAILEMLEQFQLDRDEAVADFGGEVSSAIKEVTRPIDDLISWLTRELKGELR